MTLKNSVIVCDLANFNSHAHVERDANPRVTSIYNPNFNSHAHVERDIQDVRCKALRLYFNSHAHVERDE